MPELPQALAPEEQFGEVLFEPLGGPLGLSGALIGPMARMVALSGKSDPAIPSRTAVKPVSINAIAANAEYFIACSLGSMRVIAVDRALTAVVMRTPQASWFFQLIRSRRILHNGRQISQAARR